MSIEYYKTYYFRHEPYSRQSIVRRALSKIGSAGYNVFSRNCEHFANWCRYGREISRQVCITFMGSFVSSLHIRNK